MRRGLLVAALHLAIVSSLGGKLLYDRATRPRVWVRTAPIDPELPIRGRYVRLGVEADIGSALTLDGDGIQPVGLIVRGDRLVATPPDDSSRIFARRSTRDGAPLAVLTTPLAYFIPERAVDPSQRPAGEELWVEVTLPRQGLPRPIQLGVKRDGVLTPWKP